MTPYLHQHWCDLAIEALATFAFVAAVVASGGNALVVGAALAAAIIVAKALGGRACHLNPAVTLAFWAAEKKAASGSKIAAGGLDGVRAAALICAQVIGGVAAALVVIAVR
jgi:glycerol uptake facilitator-like aquaporin